MASKLRKKFYNYLRNKYTQSIDTYRKHKAHNIEYYDKHRFVTKWYLLKLLFAEKFNRSAEKVKPPRKTIDPNKIFNEPIQTQESLMHPRQNIDDFVEKLSRYDVISFDVFDTCIFRPFEKPTDLFSLLEKKNGIFNFKHYRILAEKLAREKFKPFEVRIEEIYDELQKLCPISRDDYKQELLLEKKVCYANPYMLEVYNKLRKKGKSIIFISDMYLPDKTVAEILAKNGFRGYDELFVSSTTRKNKAPGNLFELAKNAYPEKTKFVHVGDNIDADIFGAKTLGINSYHYENSQLMGKSRRPKLDTLSSTIYNGIVNNELYNGKCELSQREEFGFVYAAPIVVGFCDWINRFVENKKLDKILFLSRDMDIFHKVYNRKYKKYDNEYIKVSRFALQEIIACDYPIEFFNYTLAIRGDKGYTIKRALTELNLEVLFKNLKKFGLKQTDYISSENTQRLMELFQNSKDLIAESYKEHEQAAKMYFKKIIGNSKKICVCDLGWRGSNIAYLKYLLVDKWKMVKEFQGVVIGTTGSETSIELTSNELLSAYAFSHNRNREFLKTDWKKSYIFVMLMEAIFTSPDPGLIEYRLSENNKTELFEMKTNLNKELVEEFHSGIMKFITKLEWVEKLIGEELHFSPVEALESMMQISENYEFIASVVGDIVDTPHQLSGLDIEQERQSTLRELIIKQGIIK